MQSCFEEQTSLNRCTSPQRYPEANNPPEPEPVPEPILTDNMRLSSAERQRCLTRGLCLYRGTGGHVISTCPIHPPRLLVSAIHSKKYCNFSITLLK